MGRKRPAAVYGAPDAGWTGSGRFFRARVSRGSMLDLAVLPKGEAGRDLSGPHRKTRSR
jgi:hypothetical protein